MNKCMIVLCMYDDLQEYGAIKVKECADRYGISVSSFYRYLKLLNDYVGKRKFYKIVYDRKNQEYKLKKINFL
ncbi:MAG: hypothetical protein IJF76_02005 [Clostridia bacterium]|nr:hypothetical protein [Clostridia bacterium]